MWYSVIAVLFIIDLSYVQAQCPPKESDMKMIVKFLENALDEVKKTKPGTNPKDADFVVYRIAKDIVNNKKYAPCNDNFNWNEVLKDAVDLRSDCYKPSDYSTQPPQKAFMECAKKHFPALVLKYGAPAISACTCFSSTIIPNWDSRYKKFAIAYLTEYKSLKHRKK